MLEIIKKMLKNMASCEENRNDKTDVKRSRKGNGLK